MAVDHTKTEYALHHIGLTVASIERSAAFYTKLGFEPRNPETIEVSGSWIEAITGFSDARLRIALISIGAVTLELLEYIAPKGAKTTSLGTSDSGSTHLAVHVHDIDAEYQRLLAEGIEFKSEPTTIPEGATSWSGTRCVYFLDPDGNTVELVEPHSI